MVLIVSDQLCSLSHVVSFSLRLSPLGRKVAATAADLTSSLLSNKGKFTTSPTMVKHECWISCSPVKLQPSALSNERESEMIIGLSQTGPIPGLVKIKSHEIRMGKVWFSPLKIGDDFHTKKETDCKNNKCSPKLTNFNSESPHLSF